MDRTLEAELGEILEEGCIENPQCLEEAYIRICKPESYKRVQKRTQACKYRISSRKWLTPEKVVKDDPLPGHPPFPVALCHGQLVEIGEKRTLYDLVHGVISFDSSIRQPAFFISARALSESPGLTLTPRTPSFAINTLKPRARASSAVALTQ